MLKVTESYVNVKGRCGPTKLVQIWLKEIGSRTKCCTCVSVRTGSVSISEGVATQARKDPSVFLYRVNSSLPAIIARHLPGSGFYQILDTDYDSFAVMWRCTSLAILHIGEVSSHKLTGLWP